MLRVAYGGRVWAARWGMPCCAPPWSWPWQWPCSKPTWSRWRTRTRRTNTTRKPSTASAHQTGMTRTTSTTSAHRINTASTPCTSRRCSRTCRRRRCSATNPENLYLAGSRPMCLYPSTYDILLARGMDLVEVAAGYPDVGFTAEEQAWLDENPVIRVSYDPHWYPIEYEDESGQLAAGVTAKYLYKFEMITGAEFAPVDTADWTAAAGQHPRQDLGRHHDGDTHRREVRIHGVHHRALSGGGQAWLRLRTCSLTWTRTCTAC